MIQKWSPFEDTNYLSFLLVILVMGVFLEPKSYNKIQENKTKIGSIRVNDSELNKPIRGLA